VRIVIALFYGRRRPYLVAPQEGRDAKKARMSWRDSWGISSGAKWPPVPKSLQLTMLLACGQLVAGTRPAPPVTLGRAVVPAQVPGRRRHGHRRAGRP
jgi:hypothetical protein